jgi:DNA-nicking Smr family endonuclease
MRRLGPDERALWNKVVESVRPLHAPPAAAAPDPEPEAGTAPPPKRPRGAVPPAPAPAPRKGHGTTLDASWDRRLGRGLVQPDMVLDLHGHDLATAYDLVDARLEAAIAGGARILLLVTGKPPGTERPVARGRIRSAVGDWLAASRHAGRIAAVRNAHARHGGAGALYVVLRRPR